MKNSLKNNLKKFEKSEKKFEYLEENLKICQKLDEDLSETLKIFENLSEVWRRDEDCQSVSLYFLFLAIWRFEGVNED